jgi:hypothetical protein
MPILAAYGGKCIGHRMLKGGDGNTYPHHPVLVEEQPTPHLFNHIESGQPIVERPNRVFLQAGELIERAKMHGGFRSVRGELGRLEQEPLRPPLPPPSNQLVRSPL